MRRQESGKSVKPLDEELLCGIVAHFFPGAGDPNDMTCDDFETWVGRVAKLLKWKSGGSESDRLEERMQEVLRMLPGNAPAPLGTA